MRKVMISTIVFTILFLAASACNSNAGESSTDGSAAPEGWYTDFEEAAREAEEKNLPILVDFSGSDWCGWCIKLDKEVFSTPEFMSFAEDNLILLVLDFPRNKFQSPEQKSMNKKLARKYRIQGFPTVLLLDSEGTELARTGYKKGGGSAYVEHLKELLANN